MGTVISAKHLDRIETMVQSHAPDGAILAGGKRLLGTSSLDGFDFSKGSFFPPTVIKGIGTENDLWREEIFGPVVVVKGFSVCVLSPPILLMSSRVYFVDADRSRRSCFRERLQIWFRGGNLDHRLVTSAPGRCRH